MSNSAPAKRNWITIWWPVVLMTAVIGVESTQFLGSDHTGRFLRPLYQAIFGSVDDGRWETIHYYLRKCGHFFGYGLVGLSWLRAWRMVRPQWQFRIDAALALVATLAIASADEFHQSFLANRTSSPWDVVIDCSGAAFLQCLAYMLLRFFRGRHVVSAV